MYDHTYGTCRSKLMVSNEAWNLQTLHPKPLGGWSLGPTSVDPLWLRLYRNEIRNLKLNLLDSLLQESLAASMRVAIPDFVKCVQKIGKNSIERQGVQLSMYREPNHLNLKLNLVRQLIISSLPQTSVRFFGFKRKSHRILESCYPFDSATRPRSVSYDHRAEEALRVEAYRWHPKEAFLLNSWLASSIF